MKAIKSITVCEIFGKCPQVKKCYGVVNFGLMAILQVLVGKRDNEVMIATYVKKQGNEYSRLYANEQLTMF